MTDPSLPFQQRLAMHAALAEPHRLAICDALALSDRSPSELAALLGTGSNLLAHHLAVLTAAGLVETVPSAGDRRRRYVRLRGAAVEAVAPAPLSPASVLFVCTHNSARSQFAAAFWRRASSIPATSAGTHPAERVHAEARRAARRRGLDLTGAVPRAIPRDEAAPDLVVTVCDEANEELALTGRAGRLHWSVPDPVRAGTPRAFDEALEAVAARVAALAKAVGA